MPCSYPSSSSTTSPSSTSSLTKLAGSAICGGANLEVFTLLCSVFGVCGSCFLLPPEIVHTYRPYCIGNPLRLRKSNFTRAYLLLEAAAAVFSEKFYCFCWSDPRLEAPKFRQCQRRKALSTFRQRWRKCLWRTEFLKSVGSSYCESEAFFSSVLCGSNLMNWWFAQKSPLLSCWITTHSMLARCGPYNAHNNRQRI